MKPGLIQEHGRGAMVAPSKSEHVQPPQQNWGHNYMSELIKAYETNLDQGLPEPYSNIVDKCNSMVDTWLAQPEIDLAFDPFRVREAHLDPYLDHYLIDHGAFADLWGPWSTFLFADAGGGKSAFRARLANACRLQIERSHIFPIVIGSFNPAQNIKLQILQASAVELLLQLIHQPERYFALDTINRAYTRYLFNAYCSLWPIWQQRIHAISLSDNFEADFLEVVSELWPTTVGLFGPPPPSLLAELVDHLTLETSLTIVDLTDLWDLLHDYGFETVYILVDGLDSRQTLQYFPDKGLSALLLFLQEMKLWYQNYVYLKCFVPIELFESLSAHLSVIKHAPIRTRVVQWTSENLRNLVSQRLIAASRHRGQVSSLSALAMPSLRGIEEYLLNTIQPLPRDLIMLIEQIFIEHVLGPEGTIGRITQQDISSAITWYKKKL
jgi:hypothetical protein